jgi:hypothetical protein
MSTQVKNAAFLFAAALILIVAWARTSMFRSTAMAADTSKAVTSAQAKSDCGCSGQKFEDNDPIVRGVQSDVTDNSAETARQHRMSANLLKHQLKLTPEAAATQRTEWVTRFHSEHDPLLREEIITEMVQLDDAATLDAMMSLFEGEPHAGVRDQIVLIVGYLSATNQQMPRVCRMFGSAFDRGDSNLAERQRVLDILSNIPSKDAVAFMKMAFTSPRATAEDRFAAAEGLFKLAPRVKIAGDLLNVVTERLRHDARSLQSLEERSMAVHALAAPGRDNKAFFRELLKTEQDPKLARFLKAAAEEFPTH